MPKDNETRLEHFEDLIDDCSPLKSLIDRRIVPSNDKRVKIVGTKRPDVRDFFNYFNEISQVSHENRANENNGGDDINQTTIRPIVKGNYNYKNENNAQDRVNSNIIKKTSSSPVVSTTAITSTNHNNNEINEVANVGVELKYKSINCKNDDYSSNFNVSDVTSELVGDSISSTSSSPATQSSSPNLLTSSPSSSTTTTTTVTTSIVSSSVKSDKRLIEHDGSFKFIKWTANHRGYKINPSKRNTWFNDSREDEENATIVSLKIISSDPVIGDSCHHFVNAGAKRSSKLLSPDKLSAHGLGEQFARARSNSSPESKSSSKGPITVHFHENGGIDLKPSKGTCQLLTTNDDIRIKETNETTNEKKRIGEIIRNLLRRRPTLDEMREKGILIDGPVFGCDLTSLCNREGQLVPRILQYCIEAIEVKGLQTDGLYRICGNLSEVQKIRFQVNQGNYETIWSQENVHVITGVLKLFLRDLKEPLLPFDLFNSFMFAIGLTDKKDKLEAFQKLVNQLPKCNYHTLVFLLRHLLRVVQYQDKNRMQIQNVSIIFGPSLMWPRTESNDFSYDMMLRVHCNRIVEMLLTEFNNIFMVSTTSV